MAIFDQSACGSANLEVPIARAALDAAQQLQVQQNIGLVYVHLNHFSARYQFEWTRREWEDLIQEGCLGLIRAAQDFNPRGPIPFAAFALPRIHRAVRRAMLKRRPAGAPIPKKGPAQQKQSKPRVSRKLDWSPRKPKRPLPGEDPLETIRNWKGLDADTVGGRLRDKHDRAVGRALARLRSRTDLRPFDAELFEMLVAHRHLVPDDHDRKPYRQLALQLGVPYGRVIECDQQIRQAVRRDLEGDPEFTELMRLAATMPEGVAHALSNDFETSLARLSSAEMLKRLLNSSREQRGHLIGRLLEHHEAALRENLRNLIESLPPHQRETLLSESSPVIA